MMRLMFRLKSLEKHSEESRLRCGKKAISKREDTMSEPASDGSMVGTLVLFRELHRTLSDKVSEAVVNLYHELWPTQYFDRELRGFIRNVLTSFGATALLVQQTDEDLSLFCWESFDPRTEDSASRETIREGVERLIDEIRRSKRPSHPQIERSDTKATGRPKTSPEFHRLPSLEECAISFVLRDRDLRGAGGGTLSIAALVFRPREVMQRCTNLSRGGVWPDDFESVFNDTFVRIVGSQLLPMILDAFRYRELRFAAFPPKLSRRYWDDAPFIMRFADQKKTLNNRLSPPWNDRPDRRREELIPTASLSLDLRKSTFCMEFATNEREFGEWLDHLVEKMRSVAHLHGGIFDKFTGDGALIHFLQKECQLLYEGRSAVDSAIHCAVDLQRAVEIHMKSLRQMLHHDSRVFGAGIAIDVGEAFWSCDNRDNPVVVGKVVVGACRVGDKAPRQSVRLTNWAYWSATEILRAKLKGIRQVSLSTKESSDEVPLECWEFNADQDMNVGRGPRAIEELCQQIKQRFEATKGLF